MGATIVVRDAPNVRDPSRPFPSKFAKLASSQWLRRIFIAGIAAIGYYLGTEIGFLFTPAQSPISAFWPPNAVLLAVLLLIPIRTWWGPILLVLPVHLVIQLHAGVPILTSGGWFVGNVSEAVLGAALVRRYTNPVKMFESVRGTAVFLGCAVVAAPMATSFIDAAAVVMTGHGNGYWMTWTERLLSNCLAELVFVPTIVGFTTHAVFSIQRAKPVRYLEACAFGFTLVTVSYLAFSFDYARFHGSPALIYLPLSLLVWAALRFGIVALGLSLLTIAATAVEGAMVGRGPFTTAYMRVDLLPLQLLLCTAATPLLILTALVAERRQIENSLRKVAQRLITAQENERQRIARELHDDIGQQLAVVESELLELKDHLAGTAEPKMDEVSGKVSEISRSVRELSHGLHPSAIEHLGLRVAMRRLCRDLTAAKGINVQFEDENLDPDIPPAITLCLFRISQEALNNIVRHSGASEVSVRLRMSKGVIRLRIADNGSGFEPDNITTGLGLIGMEERLRAVEGTLSIATCSGEGTRLDVAIPLDAGEVSEPPSDSI